MSAKVHGDSSSGRSGDTHTLVKQGFTRPRTGLPQYAEPGGIVRERGVSWKQVCG